MAGTATPRTTATAATPDASSGPVDASNLEALMQEMDRIRDLIEGLTKRTDHVEDSGDDVARAARAAQVNAQVARAQAEKIADAISEVSGHLRHAVTGLRDTKQKVKKLYDLAQEAQSGR